MTPQQTVEYIFRARFQEPPDNPAVPAENRIGPGMFEVLAQLEELATDQEIVARTVDPDRPRRQLCPMSTSWHGRHFITDRRWTLTTPDGATVTLCSAACALTWLCHALPADRPTSVSAGGESVSTGGPNVPACATGVRPADPKTVPSRATRSKSEAA